MNLTDAVDIVDCTPPTLMRWATTRGIRVAIGQFSRPPSRAVESAGVRTLARMLFEQAGQIAVEISRGTNGCPQWPEGWTGSLAHSSGYAMAAIVEAKNVSGLGVDIELPSRLNRDMWPHVLTAGEGAALAGYDRLKGDRQAAAAFAAKEAAYKALYPHFSDAVGFLDTEVQFLSSEEWRLHVCKIGLLPLGLGIGGIHLDVGLVVATLCVAGRTSNECATTIPNRTPGEQKPR